MDETADWVSYEFAPWEGVRIARDDLHRGQREACAGSTTMRILRVRDGQVEIAPHRDDRSSAPASRINGARAELYRSTMERLVREHRLGGSCEMLV